MALERTFAIIKPDSVERRHVGEILARIEREGFRLRIVRGGRAAPVAAVETGPAPVAVQRVSDTLAAVAPAVGVAAPND